MTVQELSRYLTLRKQIDEDKEIYENMCQKMGPASPSLSGMPHTPGVRDKVGDLAADLADLDAGIKELEAEAERVLPAIEEFCVSISDPRMRLISGSVSCGAAHGQRLQEHSDGTIPKPECARWHIITSKR